jgi:LPS-assembly protein
VTSIDVSRVSDVDFLEDFDDVDQVEHVDFLRSSVTLSRGFTDWDAKLLFEEHQIINESKSIAARPYRRLPQLTLNRQQSGDSGEFNLAWKNELVRFDKDESITGDRLHLQPIISYPLQEDAYFLKPELQLDYTRYQLDNNDNGGNDLERSIPLLSIDSGLFFERPVNDSQWLQTLEPRFYLLYVPYEDQQEIPDFDTALLRENYSNLFINNRFSGGDRIGDSKQASIGLTTRFIDQETGREFFSAGVGQAFFTEDRQVSLNGSTDTRDKSSLMTQLTYRPSSAWTVTLDSAYDQDEKESLQTDLALRYRAEREVFNLEYHKRDESLEQSALSFVYPMSNRWTGYFKRHYSIRKERPVQNLAGLTYESCCWRFDLLYEEDSNSELSETDYGVLLQLTFKGLSSAGKDIGAILEDGILGYRSPY